MQQRGLRRLGVVAQRGHRLAPAVEVHRELRRSHRHAGRTLPFEGRADLAMQMGASRRRGALVQHLAEQGMPERVGRVATIGISGGTRRREPHVLAHHVVAGVGHRGQVALEGQRHRLDTEFDPADRRRREQGTLLFPAWRCSGR